MTRAPLLALACCLAACTTTDHGETTSAQPAQPTSGPGGSAYAHRDWRVSSGGQGVFAWYAFEPIDPAPTSAPLAIILHGYGEYSGYDQMYELIRHTVRTGNIVIYPRWQTGPRRRRRRRDTTVAIKPGRRPRPAATASYSPGAGG